MNKKGSKHPIAGVVIILHLGARVPKACEGGKEIVEKSTLHSGYEEIGWSLRETLDNIVAEGETPQLKFEMLLKYARLLFIDGNYDRCQEVLQQASAHSIDNGVREIEDLYFWANRCLEERGNTERAISS